MMRRSLLLRGAAAVTAFLLPALAAAASIEDTVHELQREWETIYYQTPAQQRVDRYEALIMRAARIAAQFPERAEPAIWHGIIVSSLAGAKGGLGALSLAREAKAIYEKALKINPTALDGSAYNSLAVLYYKVPGWPLGFGDKHKAQELLQKGLALNPSGIDANYFYGEYLIEAGKPAEAIPYLERALAAPPRPGREVADAGRRDEARALLEKARPL